MSLQRFEQINQNIREAFLAKKRADPEQFEKRLKFSVTKAAQAV